MNLYGQINETSSLQGNKDSLVVVNINTIKEANIKLTERIVLKEIVAQQDTIIFNQYGIIDKYKQQNLYLADENLAFKTSYKEAEELNKKLQKSINRKNTGLWILGGIAGTAIVVVAVQFLIGNGK